MMSEHNLIENGSFKDASVTSWQRAHRNPKPLVFHDYTLEKKLILLEPGEVLEQSIDAERIGHYRSFLIKGHGTHQRPECNLHRLPRVGARHDAGT